MSTCNDGKSKIILGRKAFEAMRTRFGVLYGSQFTINGISLVKGGRLEDYQMITTDPKLGDLFDELEVISEGGSYE